MVNSPISQSCRSSCASIFGTACDILAALSANLSSANFPAAAQFGPGYFGEPSRTGFGWILPATQVSGGRRSALDHLPTLGHCLPARVCTGGGGRRPRSATLPGKREK